MYAQAPRAVRPQLRQALVLFYLLAVPSGLAQNGGQRNLADASLEELMNIDVSSVSRKQQKLSRSAAAVYVVSADDIRRSGATSIPEILRMVPGLQVARIDSSHWAVSTRGFDARFSNKMLVLIDGRSIYNNIFAGVIWDQYDVVLEDIERIEVIRGPGGTMWGANAVNGVINVITRKAKDTQGTLASLTTGSDDLATTALRHGGELGTHTRYRLFGKQLARNHMSTGPLDNARDSWNMVRGGGRLEFDAGESDSFTFHGDLYRGGAGTRMYATFPSVDPRYIAEDRVASSGGYLQGGWLHRHESGAETALQVYYNVENRREAIAALYMKTLDVDLQQRLAAWKRHELMWGAGFRRYSDHAMAGLLAGFNPARRIDNLYSSWVQDELSLLPDRLILTGGVKLQHNSYTGLETQPSVRLFVEPKENHSLWFAWSKAVRTPSRRDSDLLMTFQVPYDSPIPVVGTLVGNPHSVSEKMHAYEIGYRTQVARRIAFDIAAFTNRYADLQTIVMGTATLQLTAAPRIFIPVDFTYEGRARAYGAEAATTWSLRSNWKLTGNYAWLRTRLYEGNTTSLMGQASIGSLYASHQSFLRSSYDVSRRWSTDWTLYYTSRMHGNPIPAGVRLDFRIGFRPDENSEWSVGMANLLDPRHQEFIPEDYVVPSEIRRSFYVRYSWGR